MPSNKAVRIIKREQRELLANQQEVPASKTETQTKRDIFRTITLWIEDKRNQPAAMSPEVLFTQVSVD